MSALTAHWPCPECAEQVALPVHVTSTGTIRDDTGKATGVTLTPEVDTTPAAAHLTDVHGIESTWTPTT